ncbi:MAG TPA: CbtB-domain containing protein [Chloroflexota bacterium]|jgi:hypothetical protein|nr:CbtB-domain containing protein [Chloroflexota bacterium]
MRPLAVTPVAVSPRVWLLLLLGLFGLFVLGFDQGQTLALVQGQQAFDLNLIHELVHDMRHAAGFPCH